MTSTMMRLVLAEATRAIDLVVSTKGTTFEKCYAALKAAMGLVILGTDEDTLDDQFGGAAAALMTHFGEGSREYTAIKKEVDTLKFLAGAMGMASCGMSVDFTQMPSLEEGEKGLGLIPIWRALHGDGNIEEIRRRVEGDAPAQPPQSVTPPPTEQPSSSVLPPHLDPPDWWKSETPEVTWEYFVSHDQECSNACRVLSNVEFQLDWLKKAVVQLGIALPVPHPDHPVDVKMKNAGLAILVKRLAAIRSDVANLKPLAEEEFGTIACTLAQSPIPNAMDRFTADVVRSTMSRVNTEFKSAMFRATCDDPVPKSN